MATYQVTLPYQGTWPSSFPGDSGFPEDTWITGGIYDANFDKWAETEYYVPDVPTVSTLEYYGKPSWSSVTYPINKAKLDELIIGDNGFVDVVNYSGSIPHTFYFDSSSFSTASIPSTASITNVEVAIQHYRTSGYVYYIESFGVRVTYDYDAPPDFEGTKTQLGGARVTKVLTSGQASSGRISKTINSLQTAISYIVLMFTDSQDSVARVQKALTSVQNAVSSVRARTVFSRGSYESLPIDDSDLTIPYNSTEVSNVSAEDGAYASQGGSGFVLHEYKVYHNFSTATITVKWVGKSTVPCNEEPVYLQIYNYNAGVWVTLDSDSTSSAGANFELIGTPSGNNGDYYDPDGFIAVRVYQ